MRLTAPPLTPVTYVSSIVDALGAFTSLLLVRFCEEVLKLIALFVNFSNTSCVRDSERMMCFVVSGFLSNALFFLASTFDFGSCYVIVSTKCYAKPDDGDRRRTNAKSKTFWMMLDFFDMGFANSIEEHRKTSQTNMPEPNSEPNSLAEKKTTT